jgi:thiamine transport system permease protein
MKYLRWLFIASLPMVFVLLMCVLPLLRLGFEAFNTFDKDTSWQGLIGLAGELMSDDYLQGRLCWTLLQAGMTTLLVLVIGLPIAAVLARFTFIGRALILRFVMLPFVTPTLVAAMAILMMASSINDYLLSHSLTGDVSPVILLLYGNVFFNLGILIRSAIAGFTHIGASPIQAARSLGASPWRVFWRIEIALLRPYLLAALCLVFIYSFSGFGLALLLGGQNYGTLEVEIYTLITHELKLADAALLALGSFLITGSAALIHARLERRLALPSQSNTRVLKTLNTLGSRFACTLSVLGLGLICLAPLMTIALTILRLIQLNWHTVFAVLTEKDTLLATQNTLLFSGVSVIFATLIGVLHALVARRSTLLRALVLLPLVISPIALGLGILLLYSHWSGSLALLIASYSLLAYPLIAQPLGAALDALPVATLQAAQSLGANPWRCFWRITLPTLTPALRRGMALATASTVGEFAVSLLLSRPEWITLSTLIYQHFGKVGASHRDAAWIISAWLLCLALLAFSLIDSTKKLTTPYAHT